MTIAERIKELEQILDRPCPALDDPNAECICPGHTQAAIELAKLSKINKVEPKKRPDRVQH